MQVRFERRRDSVPIQCQLMKIMTDLYRRHATLIIYQKPNKINPPEVGYLL